MTLQDDMAADLTNVFLNTGEFALAATYLPGGVSPGFACTVVPADPAEQFVQTHTGTAEQRRLEAHGSLAALRAGIAVIETTARDPDRGDQVVIASGAYAGTWKVELPGSVDVGGCVKLTLRYDTRYDAAGAGAVEVNG